MNIQGRVKFIGKTEVLGQNGFEKRDLIITTEEQYPQPIIIQFTQGRCTLLDSLHVGENVNVHFNIRGREWTSPQGEIKYFNTLEAWKIERIQVTKVANQGYQNTSGQAPQVPSHQKAIQTTQNQLFDNFGQAPTQFQPAKVQNEDFDDLPF